MINGYLGKRKPEVTTGGWNELDDMALKSTFDFQGSDFSLSKKQHSFSSIAPKDSLSRTTFWISMEEQGRIHVKCNFKTPEKEVDIFELRGLLKKQSRVNQTINKNFGFYEIQTDSESLDNPISGNSNLFPSKRSSPKRLPSAKTLSPIKDGKKEVIIRKAGQNTKKIKISTQRYRFLDWEMTTKEKHLKPTGYSRDENFNRIEPRRPPPQDWRTPRSPVRLDTDSQNFVTFTDINLRKSKKSRDEDVEVIEKHELKYNKNTYKMEKPADRAFKIFQGDDRSGREVTNLLDSAFSIPLQEIKSTVGVVKDEKISAGIKLFEITRELSQKYTTSHHQQIIDVDELASTQRANISLKTEDSQNSEKDLPIWRHQQDQKDPNFYYKLNCPESKTDDQGNLKVCYQAELAKIYKVNPVGAPYFYYREYPVHFHDEAVLSMLKRYGYEDRATKQKNVALILNQFKIEANEHSSIMGYSKKTGYRPNFKYILIKVGLDNKLVEKDLEKLDANELHMLVAFFNVKFCILTKDDKLSPADSLDRILVVANRHISNVLQRAHNFKKNEEFLKKKWKEFLKFCKLKIKEENPVKSRLV